MQYFTYILYSEKLNKYYYGHTQNVEKRLMRHNRGYERFTKKGAPWKLMFQTSFDSKTDAMKLERKLKNMKSQKLIRDFIQVAEPGSSAKK